MKILSFLKREAVLIIAVILAAVSAFLVPPDTVYASYIDFHTLSILFCLMVVMTGLQRLGFFAAVAQAIVRRTVSIRQLILILVLLCFFFSMFITNDVALITFVPLALVTLEMAAPNEKERWMVFVVVMQTIAANLGSMLTPIGNPQNLYLYGRMSVSLGAFVMLMLPYAAASLVLIVACVMLITRRASAAVSLSYSAAAFQMPKAKLLIYGGLFLLSLLTVLNVVDNRLVLAIVLVVMVILDRKAVKQVDYSLLLTFTALFVFIGNMGRIEPFRELLKQAIEGREILTSVICSQVTSNVPAALLLSGFTERLPELTIGVNIGGLGTLIASMASLISFKAICKDNPKKRVVYLLQFSAYNLIFLAILLVMALMDMSIRFCA